MGSVAGWSDDEERSVVGDKGEIKFIDHQNDQSVISYRPSDDDPIIVSVPFPFMKGQPRSVTMGEIASDCIRIKNNTDEPVELWSINIYGSSPEDSFKLSLMQPPKLKEGEDAPGGFRETTCLEERTLQPGQELTVWVFCKAEKIGKYTTAVHVDVESGVIERVIFLMVDDKISQALSSNKPYSKEPRKKLFDVANNYVRGRRPAPPKLKGMGRSSKAVKLPKYSIPIEVREMVERRQLPDSIKVGLSLENYVAFFTALLNLEELQAEEDVKAFNMEHVMMRRRGSQFVTLEVPGLAERRPSLVTGDSIYARRVSDDENTDKIQEGIVHRVEADEVYLKFSPKFHEYHWDEHLYNIQFGYNRLNFRRQYWAIDAAKNLEKSILFPGVNRKKRHIRTTSLSPRTCVLNEEQKSAVEMILGCQGVSPYVIHGPPGTGKTMTIVEAILQLYISRGNARILVCTPSNSAADHILEKIHQQNAIKVKEDHIFRLNASSRPYEDVNPDLLPFCCYNEMEGIFMCPQLRFFQKCRIVISTYMSASSLIAEGVEQGEFSHLFLDEAGQASEPEIMIPISSLCDKNTVIVLAGDPMQLGPVVYSKKAEHHGLGKSYLERLFESEPYSSGDKNYVTKLVRNYRCRPEILDLPSSLFYNGELMACREESMYLECPIEFHPNKDFHILFIGIQGCDEREGNNPSWFNRIEASKVVEVLAKLRDIGKLTQEDIGIITPYRQQVLKLRRALEIIEMPEIKIGSVEQFQGQERHVMVVSTVRSTIKHKDFDRIHCLGFLSNPRRFNVAVTRAISLLIIVGNPHIICKDPYWNKLLWYCVDNDSYQGCALPDKDEIEIPEPSAYPGDDPYNLHQDENNWESENCTFPDGTNNWESENTAFQEGGDWAETEYPVRCTNEDEWSDGWK